VFLGQFQQLVKPDGSIQEAVLAVDMKVDKISVFHHSKTWTPNSRPHGQVGWMPRLPAAGAGRKADLIIIFFISRKPRPVGGELHSERSHYGFL
jgi:hypothetical protein